MHIVSTPLALHAAIADLRRRGGKPALVPTMGALHDGHAALMRRAIEDGYQAVTSIFVNPTQFGPREDFSRYPRMPDADASVCRSAGVEILYTPDAATMYPQGFGTTVHVKNIPDHLCGPFRPGHFDGVATVVAKLLNQAGADAAYFGEKDWQQLQVVKHLARDLDIPTRIVGVPTVRESDELALSSRNRYLDPAERQKAALLPRVLKQLAHDIATQPESANTLLDHARAALTQGGFRLDYLEWADETSCAPATLVQKPSRVFVAAYLGATRLIDNWPVV